MEIEEFDGPPEEDPGTRIGMPPSSNVAALAAQLGGLRTEISDLEAQLKPLKEQEEGIEARLFEAMENAGLRKIGVPNIGTFSLSDLAWAKIIDVQSALEWATTTAPEGMLTLNHSRLTAIVREALTEGGALPPGISYSIKRGIRWTRR